jgi:hypothetical protein
MLAYIPALLFAALAAASAGSHESIFVRRAALSAMKVEEAGQTCEPSQTLVCCDQSEKCSEVDISRKCFMTYLKRSWDHSWLIHLHRDQQVRLSLRALHGNRSLLQLR